MDPIIDSIDKLEVIVGKLTDVARKGGRDMVRDVLALRAEYAAEIAKMFGTVVADPRLQTNPEIGQQFQRHFMEVRHMITQMQLKWRTAEIEADPHGYLKDLLDLESHASVMRNWARETLSKKVA